MKEETAMRLRFTCPECGGEKLEVVYDCPTACQEVAEVHDDGSVYFSGPLQIVEEHGRWYRCQDCKASPLDMETGEPLWDDDFMLVEWLIENCPQPHEDGAMSAPDTTPVL
jgi:Zn finger protein HypA/HybF involved in hydrogenase expression